MQPLNSFCVGLVDLKRLYGNFFIKTIPRFSSNNPGCVISTRFPLIKNSSNRSGNSLQKIPADLFRIELLSCSVRLLSMNKIPSAKCCNAVNTFSLPEIKVLLLFASSTCPLISLARQYFHCSLIYNIIG